MQKNKLFLSIILCIATVSVLLVGCGNKKTEDSKADFSAELNLALDDLYSVQLNYSNGTAPLNIIPFVTVETVYDNWDTIKDSSDERIPVSIREYVDPNVVYLDYSTDYSVKWNKENGDVVVEPTDIAAREDYKQKQHKG